MSESYQTYDHKGNPGEVILGTVYGYVGDPIVPQEGLKICVAEIKPHAKPGEEKPTVNKFIEVVE